MADVESFISGQPVVPYIVLSQTDVDIVCHVVFSSCG